MTEKTWEDWSDEAAAKDKSAASSGGEFIKLPQGDSYWRFLPPLRGRKSPFEVTWQHFLGKDEVPIPGRTSALTFSCPARMGQGSCKICDLHVELSKSRLKEDRDLARKLRPNLRVFANVVDMENPQNGVQILPFGLTIHNQLMDIRENPRKGGNFTHPETGRVVIITRTGTGFSTKYAVSVDTQASELENYEWITQQHDLAELVRFPTAEDEMLASNSIAELTGHESTAAALPVKRRKAISSQSAPARASNGGYSRRAQESLDEDY